MLDVLLGASGGIFGILGALFKHGLEVYQETKKEQQSLLLLKENNAHELLMADKQAALMQLEAKNAIKLADINVTGEIEKASYGALEASYEADKATYSTAPTSPWLIAVDVVRGMIRPSLTLYFAIFLTVLTVMVFMNLPSSVYENEAFLKSTFYRLVDALIFLGTSAVGWYFAARPSTKSKE